MLIAHLQTPNHEQLPTFEVQEIFRGFFYFQGLMTSFEKTP